MKKILLTLSILLILPILVHAEELTNKLKGKILLQIEQNGEAWYVNPTDENRYYLGRPADAFRIMQNLSLGISNKTFDSFNGTAPKNLSGKILLKVEDLGRAYYVSPSDLKMHSLGSPNEAFQVMREQGLGITNANLETIPVKEGYDITIINTDNQENTQENAKANEENIDKTEENIEDNTISTSTPKISTTTNDIATSTDIIATTTENISSTTAEKINPSCEFIAKYYENKELRGFPEIQQTEYEINYDWGKDAPNGLKEKDNFSIDWEGTCYFEEGLYTLTASYDDAAKIDLDNTRLLESWKDNNREKTSIKEVKISEGYHDVHVQYYENANYANIMINWEKNQ